MAITTFDSSLFRHNKKPEEREALEDKSEIAVTIENGILCDTVGFKASQTNSVYTAEDDERFTSL